MEHRIKNVDDLLSKVVLRYEDTSTICEQKNTEHSVRRCYEKYLNSGDASFLQLHRSKHIEYLRRMLSRLPSSYESMDASQPWLCYWITNALCLLNYEIPGDDRASLIKVLKSCLHPEGGFAGGPHQMAHLATTFGGVNCLCLLNCREALEVVDRPRLFSWLRALRQPNGSFQLHLDGEIDVRGAYCAVSVARLTNLDCEALFQGTAEWIAACQTYEGGFGGAPGMEAHGGYTFCAFAALLLLRRPDACDMAALLRWAAMRQMAVEGGFQGRTNKLVDSCYSYWVGGLFPLIQEALADLNDDALDFGGWLFDQVAAQEYVLLSCQKLAGGIIDKPGRSADPYHSCYALSGLSVAQHFLFGKFEDDEVVGGAANLVRPTVPIHNISPESVQSASDFFNETYSDP